ncbi:zinc-binding dehydrogenase [Subtercola endophyticus]|uniref:zinc-binding dehydrogenase n=1 Tax=Subtercola endophyticus TaxID=2895559 RepID=UPI001E3BEE75|nr:alcohol dehydrogenase catalytic domain-containing protein [Subtercola endophyticus]UFS59667.1 alcohol dehydrogenase catalytic domain-containing protein [Subtercola endophyticus]
MRAAVLHGAGDVRLETVATPMILDARDAVVRITASCVCGSDLHPYRQGLGSAVPKRAGHEFVGVVEEVGAGVRTLSPGDFVIAPFAISDNTCINCRNGITTSCLHGSFWGGTDHNGFANDGGQGEYARVPLADGTLVRLDGTPEHDLVPHLLALSDVMGTGYHAAVTANVQPGSTVVVVGDGAVGLCGILASRLRGAERIVVMSQNPARQAIARQFGATDLVETRGDDGVAEIAELLGVPGADAVLECVGTEQSMTQAVAVARPGGTVGFVGAPSGTLPTGALFGRNLHYAGGVAPVRAYLPLLLESVLDGTLRPGAVFDRTLPLESAAEAYRLMDTRESIKVLLTP